LSGERLLLLFLRDGVAPPDGWLRLRDGAVAGRGAAFPPPPAGGDDGDDAGRIVAVVPGEDVACHWIDLPELASKQAAAAARMLAAEMSAEPVERLHVISGRPEGAGGRRPMALVSAERMSAWLAQARSLGFDPDLVLPEPLLLPPPGEDVLRWARDGRYVMRGPALALAAEPGLAALLADGPVIPIDDAAVETGLGAVIASAPLNLRHGLFAKRRPWRLDPAWLRRTGMLAVSILLATLAMQAVLTLKYSFAADRLEAETRLAASRALPRAMRIVNPQAQLDERLARLRGAGIGFTASAASLFAAVRETPQVELSSLRFDATGTLHATASAAAAEDIAAFRQRLAAAGFTVDGGSVHPGGGRQIADLVLRAP